MLISTNTRQKAFDSFVFRGGLDTETPRWEVPPGQVSESQNFEIGVNGGYVTSTGYEAFDGRPSPSSAIYTIVFVTISGEISVGDDITGGTSTATGTVIAVVSSIPAYLVATKVVGSFVSGENILVSAVVEAVSASAGFPGGALSIILDAQYANLAADEYRADIGVVPGSGRIRGVFYFLDVGYAIRDNAGGTAAVLHKSTASGWTAVALGRELAFTSGGTTQIVEGNVITGATSGATATLTRVVLQSGDWGAGTAAGRFIFASQTGTFQAENIDVGAGLNLATIAGNSSAITLAPGGRLETVIANFGGSLGQKRVYGADGVNRAFEFDGTVFVPITTAISPDTPLHIGFNKNHLFLSFGSSAQHSGIGTPYIWTPLFGAGELAFGDTITGFLSEPGNQTGGAFGVYTRNTTFFLYGSSSADWNVIRFRDELGAFPYTLQQIGVSIFLDDRGITTVSTAQEFGNFNAASITRKLQTYLNQRRSLASASAISRDKNQYRLFFSDGTGLYVTLSGNRVLGVMPVSLGRAVRCITSVENAAGNEVIFFGSDDGYVYQMERGTSFNGDALEAFFTTHFLFARAIRVSKRYYRVSFELEGEGYAEFFFSYELGYASTLLAQPGSVLHTLSFSSASWDEDFVWDSSFWDGGTLSPATQELTGTAENIALRIYSSSDYFTPLTFNGANIEYSLGRALR